jgi:integrase
MKEYAWSKDIQELEPPDIVHFRDWLLCHKSRDLARRTLSSFHSVLIEMKRQGYLSDDPAREGTYKSTAEALCTGNSWCKLWQVWCKRNISI